MTERIEKQMFDSVMTFIRTGNPNNPEIPYWEPASRGVHNTLMIDKDTQIRVNHDEQIVRGLGDALMGGMTEGLLKNMVSYTEN